MFKFMSTALEAIREELQRLQQEGVDRVFVEESTLEQLQVLRNPAPEVAQKKQSAPASELKELIGQKNPPTTKAAVPAKPSPGPVLPIPEQPASFELPEGDATAQMAWLRKQVEQCPVCNAHHSKDGKIVFGVGSVEADIFFCGEAPGADEEVEGEPFVGEAGLLLNKIIQAMGLQREDVYIDNILKWRPVHDKPYGNRPPTIEEMNFCLPYLKAQISIVKPKVIIALGNSAVTGLLGPDPDRQMGSARGTWHTFENTALLITFHPSYLLRNDTLKTKRQVWEDMLQVMEKVGLPISDKQRSFFLPKR